MSEKIYAVLTGDIVQSRRLTAEQSKALQQRLKSAASEFDRKFSGTLAGGLGITRGDGWQVALQKPEQALRLALYLRAVVKSEFGTDTRVSIGTGSVDRLEPENIIESTGPAFERSGHGLEMMRKGGRLAIDLDDASDRRDELIVRLLDCVVSRWTGKAAIALAGVLLNQTQEQIAENSPISERSGKKPTRQAIGDALIRASWPEVQACIEFFDHLLSQA
ncbi:MAG: hypothetical protein PWQ29_1279 [Verrucomicrobiota bacterium]|jgi:hypothetical protein|nr:hypothetical protein [Verrucomicrobiota bacterium]MDK2963885.1 hypothetical protein [Verrucomicrobiota bacterium]